MATIWKSERLIYRAIEEEDEGFLLETTQDSEAFANATPFILTPPGKKFAKGSRDWMESSLLGVAICLPPETLPSAKDAPKSSTETGQDKPKPTVIGYITLSSTELRQIHHRNAMIGLGLLPNYRGQGYGTEAIKWCLRWAFQYANLHRVEIGAFEWNRRAYALYERLGFKMESRKRDALFYEGRYWDMVGLAMLEDEWRELYGGKPGNTAVSLGASK